MDKKTFEIILIRKIPYLAAGLSFLICICYILLWLYFKLFGDFPISVENKLFNALNLTEPANYFFATLAIFSAAVILYFLARYRKSGLIILADDHIELLLKKEKLLFPLDKIRRVYCNDSEDKHGEPNKKFTLTIETKENKKILVRIKNAADIRQFTDKLLGYQNLTIEHFTITTLD